MTCTYWQVTHVRARTLAVRVKQSSHILRCIKFVLLCVKLMATVHLTASIHKYHQCILTCVSHEMTTEVGQLEKCKCTSCFACVLIWWVHIVPSHGVHMTQPAHVCWPAILWIYCNWHVYLRQGQLHIMQSRLLQRQQCGTLSSTAKCDKWNQVITGKTTAPGPLDNDL